MALFIATALVLFVDYMQCQHPIYVPRSQRLSPLSRHLYSLRARCNTQLDRLHWMRAAYHEAGVLTAHSAVVAYETANVVARGEREAHFDTDSTPVGIDNRCTACISHVAGDFVGP